METLNIEIFHARAAVKTYQQDFDALPKHVQHFVAQYGLRQILNDAASDQKKYGAEEVIKATDAKLQALLNGELKAARSSDPFGKWVKGQLLAALQSKGLTAKTAAAHLKKCGTTYQEQVRKLYGDDNAEKVFAKHKKQWASFRKMIWILI